MSGVELAARAIACGERKWRWMSGMVSTSKLRIVTQADANEANYQSLVPDLEDPATLDCLLALVREAWGPACVSGVAIYETTLPSGGGFVVVSDYEAAHIERFRGSGGQRAERLVAALEAAP